MSRKSLIFFDLNSFASFTFRIQLLSSYNLAHCKAALVALEFRNRNIGRLRRVLLGSFIRFAIERQSLTPNYLHLYQPTRKVFYHLQVFYLKLWSGLFGFPPLFGQYQLPFMFFLLEKVAKIKFIQRVLFFLLCCAYSVAEHLEAQTIWSTQTSFLCLWQSRSHKSVGKTSFCCKSIIAWNEFSIFIIAESLRLWCSFIAVRSSSQIRNTRPNLLTIELDFKNSCVFLSLSG